MTAGVVRDSLERTITWAPDDPDRALEALRAEFGATHEIGVDGHGRWVGLRRDGRAALMGDGPDSLYSALRDDCAPGRGAV